MAKKSSGGRKSKTKSFPIETPTGTVSDKIEDAEVVAEEVTDTVTEALDNKVDETAEVVEDNIADVVDGTTTEKDETPADDAVTVTESVDEIIEESRPSEPEAPATAPSPAPEQAKSGGFFPFLLGGLVAGGIGYGIAYFQNGSGADDLSTQIATQGAEIATLTESMTSTQEDIRTRATAESLTELNEAIVANSTQMTELGNRIDTGFSALEERVAVIERQPSADGTLQETALAAFESDMTALRDQIVAQQEELSEVLSSTRQEAQAIESNAIASARAATARASLAVIQGSLESGAPFGNALNDLAGSLDEPVPAALEAVAAEGVPTLAAIQDIYPDAARAALATARSEGAAGEESSGLGSFLRNQLDVRSVEPQEGDSADAVLSRTEAALKEGRLNDALAEAAALPEVARGALAEWSTLAEKRAAALDAAVTLASQLNVN